MSKISVSALIARGQRVLEATLRHAAIGHRDAASLEVNLSAVARGEAELLLAQTLGKDRAWFYAHSDASVAVDAVADFDRLLQRRARGEPLAYISGQREFWSLDLYVNEQVLIPRPETELLVELVLARLPDKVAVDVADLGTGSGAIALAIASERAHARILATDASEPALSVARANAQRLELRNVNFDQGNWCEALGDRRFDVIVANPPYIATDDEHLQRGDLRFEPDQALASGIDGLDAIRAIVRDAPDHLRADGWLLIEHGFEQGAALRDLFSAHGFVDILTELDLEARERVTLGRLR